MMVHVTQMDIARDVGVSQRSVSAVLGATRNPRSWVSSETARRIREAADRLGYSPCGPAQLMRGKRSGLIGVLMGDAEAEVQHHRLAFLDRLLRQRGFRIIVGHLHAPEDVDAYVEDFMAHRVEGILCLRHEFAESVSRYVPQRLSRMEHVVYLDPPSGLPAACYVKPDRRAGIRRAVAHLVASGCRRPAILLTVSAHRKRQGTPVRDRLLGYRAGLRDAGIPANRAIIGLGQVPVNGGDADIAIEPLLDEVVKRRGADAILAGNDEMAVRLLKTMQARGIRVPDDVALIGYDNHAIARATAPELTTIDHDHPRIAEALADMLTAMIDGKTLSKSKRRHLIEPKLIIRESTGGRQQTADSRPKTLQALSIENEKTIEPSILSIPVDPVDRRLKRLNVC